MKVWITFDGLSGGFWFWDRRPPKNWQKQWAKAWDSHLPLFICERAVKKFVKHSLPKAGEVKQVNIEVTQ